MHMRDYKLQILMLVIAFVVVLGCSAPPPSLRMVADEETTKTAAAQNDFKLCIMTHERLCQSPDGALIFHFPVDLEIDSFELNVVADILLTNSGFDQVVIDEYFITMDDDQGRLYRPQFTGPNDYNDHSSALPAMILSAKGQATVEFSTSLDRRALTVNSISFVYRLANDSTYSRIMVSYRPGFIPVHGD